MSSKGSKQQSMHDPAAQQLSFGYLTADYMPAYPRPPADSPPGYWAAASAFIRGSGCFAVDSQTAASTRWWCVVTSTRWWCVVECPTINSLLVLGRTAVRLCCCCTNCCGSAGAIRQGPPRLPLLPPFTRRAWLTVPNSGTGRLFTSKGAPLQPCCQHLWASDTACWLSSTPPAYTVWVCAANC
jgi:hypothetical protein